MCEIRQLSVAIALIIGLTPAWGVAGPLDPNAFTSLGPFPSLAGSYTINTSGTPTITLPSGGTITGVVYQDTPGHSLAVFDFSSINIASGETITATGSLPLVLLSQSDATIGGIINGNAPGGFSAIGGPGGGGAANPGPGAGNIIFAGGSGGGFGGAGGASGVYNIGNPAFGPSTIPSLPGGHPYGNPSASLQGGSAGGGGTGAGGAIEIGAIGALRVLAGGLIEANGASSPVANGGGSGGGIFLHGSSLSIASGALISAQGGNGGNTEYNGGLGGGSGGGGGGGGGGQVLLQYTSAHDFSLSSINVRGGLAGGAGPQSGPPIGATDGRMGAVFVNQSGNLVPEPGSFVMVTIAAAIGLGGNWCRRRRLWRD